MDPSEPFEPNAGDPAGEMAEVLEPAPKLAAKEQDLEGRTVLVLEDDPVQALLLEKHLLSLNMRVIQTETIAQATRQLQESIPDLAIFDVRLPDGSGLELCERIDGDPQFGGMPIIVLSSLSTEDMVRRTRASGGRFFLGKPYDPNVLLLLIEQLLGER